jgi:protein-tyrosine-phosphatase
VSHDAKRAIDRAPHRPVILFLCVHNAGRSQMAAAFARLLGGERVLIHSAGSAPGETLNPAVVIAMNEIALDITDERPRALTDQLARDADVVVTMGCGDACPYYPGKRYEDWELIDPAGQPLEVVRTIRDEIEGRVRELLRSLGVGVK